MVDKKISELTEKNNLESTDYLALSNIGNNKISGSNLISKTFRHVNLFVNPEGSLNQLDNSKVGDVYAIEGNGIFGQVEMKKGDTLTCILDVNGTPQTLNNFIHNRDNGLLSQSLFNRNLNPDNGGPSNQLQYNNSGDRWICSQDGIYLGKELKQGDCIECIQYTGDNPVVGNFVFWYGENNINEEIDLTAKHFSNKNVLPNTATSILTDAKSGDRFVCASNGNYIGTTLGSGDVIECKVNVAGQPSNLNNFETYPHTDNVVYKSDLIDTLDSTSITNAPTANAVKQLEDKKADKSKMNILLSLPGFPVLDGLQMALVPSLTTCTIDDSYACSSIKDLVDESIVLSQSDNSLKPELKLDSDINRFYLDFSSDSLFVDDYPAERLGGQTGKTSTLILVSYIKQNADPFPQNFGWFKRNSTGTWFDDVKYNLSIGRASGIGVVNFGTKDGSRLTALDHSAIENTLSKIICTRNDNNASFYINKSLEVSASDLTAGFNNSDTGRFLLSGHPYNGKNLCDMRFYGLFLYNREISSSDHAELDLYFDSLFPV